MLLAGKSGATHSFSLNPEHRFYCGLLKTRGTFSFDEQDGGVSVRRRLHLSNQSFLLFLFFFFRLQTHNHPLQPRSFKSYITSHLRERRPKSEGFSELSGAAHV